MGKLKNENPLPFFVRRMIGRYKPHIHDAIVNAVKEKYGSLEMLGKTITAEDISECVGEVVFGPCGRNMRMEQLCRDAVDRGEFRLLKDVINELRANTAESTSA